MEEFQITEIKFNPESPLVELVLPLGHEFFHGLVWSNEHPALAFAVHVLLQLLGYIPRICNNDAENIRIDVPKDISIIGPGLGEPQCKHSAVMITGQGHFESVKPAF